MDADLIFRGFLLCLHGIWSCFLWLMTEVF